MKIALLGYGKMGKMVEQIAQNKGHEIVSSKKDADVCIDFSHPDCVLEHIQDVALLGKNLVVGTTGWYDKLDQVKKIVHEKKIGFLYAPNFSIGVNLFLKIVSEAASLMDNFDEYDVAVFEAHHNKKADSPAGTALAVAHKLMQQIKRKKEIVHNLPHAAIQPDALHVSSIRCGAIPGTHSVVFDSLADSITLTHEARNREGFAMGAVLAAEWLLNKRGFYTMEDLFGG